VYRYEQYEDLPPDEDLRDSKGEIDNRRTPSIMSLMINTAFNGGKVEGLEGKDILIGDSPEQFSNIALSIFITALLFIPIMLCARPCIVLCSKD